MPFQNDEILCPLCHGHGHERKELLVLRSRSREFQQELQNFADEVAFGNTSGLKDPYRKEERVYSNESTSLPRTFLTPRFSAGAQRFDG